MSHRAGTGDQPIPGLVTSRRNPAHKQKAKAKEDAVKAAEAQKVQKAKEAFEKAARRRRSRSRDSSERRSVERQEEKEEEDEKRRSQKGAEERQRREAEEDDQRKRWAEEQARWAEDRRQRDEQRKMDEQRQAERQKRLKGAFSIDDDEDVEAKNAKELAEIQKRKSGSAGEPTSSGFGTSASSALVVAPTGFARGAGKGEADPVKLRAALADPSGSRSFAPGEVAEHFRRLSEMKRRFRRAEFGGPERRGGDRSKDRGRDLSRSRSREKYNSVWIKPGSSG